jgi:hypothetical protein
MACQFDMPSAENCLREKFGPATGTEVSRRSQVRMMTHKTLLLGITYGQVAVAHGVSRLPTDVQRVPGYHLALRSSS